MIRSLSCGRPRTAARSGGAWLMIVYKSSEYVDPQENINIRHDAICESHGVHTHEFIELVYTLAGAGTHYVNGVGYEVVRGDLLFINYRQTHAFTVDGSMSHINFLLKPAFMSRELMNSENIFEIFALSLFDDFKGAFTEATPVIRFRGGEMIELERLIEYMETEFRQKEAGYKSVLNACMQIVFLKMARKMKQNGHMLNDIARITPEVLKYIEDNCFEKLTLKELAEKCFYNPSYFSRVFKECYGKSLTAFIQEKRVAKAAELLVSTDWNVDKICEWVGYGESKKQFYKTFREYTGRTPHAFRNDGCH